MKNYVGTSYAGMGRGTTKERDRLLTALHQVRDEIEDCYSTGSTYSRLSSLKADECELVASLEMVMRTPLAVTGSVWTSFYI